MKLRFLSLALLAICAFSSCDKERFSNSELIDAIQQATDKQTLTYEELPEHARDLLQRDYTESYAASVQLAPDLGYEVSMRRGTGVMVGELSYVYFNLKGKELRERERRRGEGGCDREECFRIVFPVNMVMSDSTIITGNDRRELSSNLRSWYADNPNIDQRPRFQYPLELEFEDGSLMTVNDDFELLEAYTNCSEYSHERFDCRRLRANIGDFCYQENRIEGVVNDDCECE